MILFGIAISLRAFFPGEIQVWINGTTVMNIKGLQMRNTTASVFRGMHFQTFFGGALFSFANVLDADRVSVVRTGGTPEYASPKTQKAWFADISGAIMS
jgi:hypothetical protein